jgi:hypothetical protein
VGTVEIGGGRPLEIEDSEAACFETDDEIGLYTSVLDRLERFENPLKPNRQPLPIFFDPFRRVMRPAMW